jgi:hypothetical protein
LTLIFIGYFQVWLPGPGAGLQLIGIEIGEWIKFLGVGSRRNYFYLPPIVLGLLIALLSALLPNGRWQTWVARGLAIAVALLAFPAIAAIQLEPASEWLARLLMIALVVILVALVSLFSVRSAGSSWPWFLMALVAVSGLVLPTIQYLAVRPVVEDVMQRDIGIGPGLWLNLFGCLIVMAVSLFEFAAGRRKTE